jgi:E1A/CREB-binding protein
MKDLVTYARKTEKGMFELAPDKAAYYHMLTEKIYKIQKEMQERKNRRLNERQLQNDHNNSNTVQEQKKIDWDNMAEAIFFLDDLKNK